MTETIHSISYLCTLIEKQEFADNKDTTVIYRGHASEHWELKPKIGRMGPPLTSSKPRPDEKLMLELFRRSSVGLAPHAHKDDWELLAIAQHHGMATRFMDWTRNPLVAAYFAVADDNREYRPKEGSRDSYELKKPDSVIYAWRCRKVHLEEGLPSDPWSIRKVSRYIPRHITPRIRAQSGLFSVHPDPTEELGGSELERLIIPWNSRKEMKKALYKLGIHGGTIFPDIDGAARHVDWLQTDTY